MKNINDLKTATWSDLTEAQPIETLTPIEKKGLDTSLTNGLSQFQMDWVNDGFVVLENFLNKDLMEAYKKVRERLPKDKTFRDNYFGGWAFPTPYMICEELKEFALEKDLMGALELLIGHEMGLHLCLTGWVSTERNFHQDSYLNPAYLWSNYLAVWMALDDIDANSGPFQYVKGSHKWDVIRQEKLFSYLTPDQKSSADWPTFTQNEVARVCEEEIERRGAKVEEFVPGKGDVLIWHSNLVHRGSEPKDKSLLRKSLICHYSAVDKRKDMPVTKRHTKTNGVYFDLPVAFPIRL